MNQTLIVISAIVMLVLLFLKVPVFISVLSAAAVYFIGNPDTNSIILPSGWCPARRPFPSWPSPFSRPPGP